MKRLWLVLCFFPLYVQAQEKVSYIDEARMLGSVAGQGMACKANRYDDFELLARAIILSKAPSDELQSQALQRFLEEKANAYITTADYVQTDCPDILTRFDKQEIFDAKLYADGSITFKDGSVITPRKPYDATLIYKKK